MFKEKITSLISFFILIGFIWDCNYLFLSLPAFFCFTYYISIIVIKLQNNKNVNKELNLKLEYIAVISCLNILVGIFAYRKTLESCSLFWKFSILTFLLTLLTIILLDKKYCLQKSNKSFIFFISLFFASFVSTVGVYTNKYIVTEKNIKIRALLISKEITKGRLSSTTHIIRFKDLNNKKFKLEIDESVYNSLNVFDEINLITNKGILGCHYILKVEKGLKEK